MTELEEQFYQSIKSSIKESKIKVNSVDFTPVKRVLLELPLQPKSEIYSSIGKQRLYELIGKAICED